MSRCTQTSLEGDSCGSREMLEHRISWARTLWHVRTIRTRGASCAASHSMYFLRCVPSSTVNMQCYSYPTLFCFVLRMVRLLHRRSAHSLRYCRCAGVRSLRVRRYFLSAAVVYTGFLVFVTLHVLSRQAQSCRLRQARPGDCSCAALTHDARMLHLVLQAVFLAAAVMVSFFLFCARSHCYVVSATCSAR